jgi:fructose-1,6-bisphosphatase/inositol monophosphatase family enzyme
MLPDVDSILARLIEFQATVRRRIVQSRAAAGMHRVDRSTSADTIYGIDTLVEPILEEFCRDWSKTTPLVLIAEGLEPDPSVSPVEGVRTFPDGTPENDCAIRLIVDPIDGTRGLMYDKRPAWALAGVAPNRGPATRLRDIEAAVMTELPTSKMGSSDVLWARRGGGAHAQRVDLRTGSAYALELKPSAATGIDHGFATVSNFFPGTKVLAAELMEQIAASLIGKADVTRATVFDDQYISTGGQFYELIVGHDRFIADLRPLFYAAQGQPEGLCCHPYDCATLLIALEAGIEVTNGLGEPLDGPLDVTTGLSWAGYANANLRARIEPTVTEFIRRRLPK